MRPVKAICFSSMLCCVLIACGGGESSNETFTTTEQSSGALLTQVNASDDEAWVYVDLDDTEAFLSSEETTVWDLAFRRQLVQVHNEELVAIAILDDIAFDAVDGAPTADKFFNDASKDEDDLAFSQERGWYSYNLLKHKLSPRQPRTYIVRSTEGILYKLSFTGYYDDAGNGGFPTFEWARVDGKKIIAGGNTEPCSEEEQLETSKEATGHFDTVSSGTLQLTQDASGVVSATLDASLGGPEQAAKSSYLYLDLVSGKLLDLSDAAARSSTAWQIAIKRSELRANSADSGAGAVFVASQDEGASDLASLSGIPSDIEASDWREDDYVDMFCNVETFGLDFIETAFGQWYDYDFENHAVNIEPDRLYIVQDRNLDRSWAFAIDGFDDGVYTLRWKPL